MRHRKAGIKLNRTSSHRNAMFRNMVTSLLKHERIRTTDTRAKEVRRWADHVITLAKRGDLHARRQALAIVREKQVVHKLFAEAQDRFGEVSGGYTRVVKLGRRTGDAAPISLVELVTPEAAPKKKPKKKKSAERKPAPQAGPAVEAPAAEAAAPAPVEDQAAEPEALADAVEAPPEAPAPDAPEAEAVPEAAAAEETAEAESATVEAAPVEEETAAAAPEEAEAPAEDAAAPEEKKDGDA